MPDTVDSDSAHGDTIRLHRGFLSQLKTVLQQEPTKRWIQFIALVYTAIGVMISVQYAAILLLVNTQLPVGGAAILTQYVLIPLFASGLLAVGLGLSVGSRSTGELAATAASGIGAYLGYLGFVLTIVVATRIVGSDFVSSAIGVTTEGLLSELIISGFGIALVGAGAGYLGFRYAVERDGTDTDSPNSGQANADDDTVPRSRGPLAALTGTFTDKPTANTTWTTVYAFTLLGVGYGVSAILLNIATDGFVPILLTLLASHGVVFSAPLLAAYFGVKAGRMYSNSQAALVGFVGGGVGFVSMVLVMTLLGSFGPDAGLLNNFSSSIELLQGDVGAASDILSEGTEMLFGIIPRGYELSRVLFIGGLGSAVAGGVAAYAAQGHERWI